MKRRSLFVGMILVVVGVSGVLWGQTRPAPPATSAPAGTVIGSVVDTAGKASVDCIVILVQEAQKMREPLETSTDKAGKFKLERVPEGKYTLRVRTRDAKGSAVKSIQVLEDRTADAGKLTLGSRRR